LHENCEWQRVKSALEANPEALWSINQMEAEGHKPDVYNFDNQGFDIGTCSKKPPISTSQCLYDAEELAEVKKEHPKSVFTSNFEPAVERTEAMGIEIMSPSQYEKLQAKGKFDHHKFNIILTDAVTRKAGKVIIGVRSGDSFDFDEFTIDPKNYGAYDGWRGTLRVSWV
jgi:hypothetical protein